MQNRIVFTIVFLLLMIGCSKPIFTKTIDYSLVSKTPIKAAISGDEYGVVKIKNDPISNIEIKCQKVRSSCSTERFKSLGSDFDGYILIEIYKDHLLAAKAQMDFKTEPSKRDFEAVWKKLAGELKWAGSL